MKFFSFILPVLVGMSITMQAAPSPGQEYLLETGWMFTRGDPKEAQLPDLDVSGWERVRIPHDWAIPGPFDPEIDKQVV